MVEFTGLELENGLRIMYSSSSTSEDFPFQGAEDTGLRFQTPFYLQIIFVSQYRILYRI